MKLYEKKTLFGISLRTGFLAVAFLLALCMLTSCGRKDKLLSELKQENAAAEDKAVEAEGVGENRGDLESAQYVERAVDAENVKNAKQASDDEAVKNAAKAKSIYVHVCGAVKSPGVYELPEGSRFFDAVEIAGGFAEGASQNYLNMAAYLADGSRLEIPTAEEIERRKEEKKEIGRPDESGNKEYSYYTVQNEVASGVENVDSSSSGLVNINTADIAGLCALPGIGEGRAKAIIEYREKQGIFQKKEDIMQVSGIGEKMYARMEAYLTIE